MNNKTGHSWILMGLLSLVIVAILGTLMRYKIAYSLPWIDQKNLQHAHSHFAFGGWITNALMALMVRKISFLKGENLFPRYKLILLANLICAFGMLFSFPFQGYGTVSISFSALSILVSFIFAGLFWYDLRRISKTDLSPIWFRAALIFNVISSVGTLYLAYMMATRTADSARYLASVYYYLHFQYNGWFFFACMGLFSFWLSKAGITDRTQNLVFWMFAIACVPAYFLSALWLPIPIWVYVLVVAAALSQGLAWIILVKNLWPKRKTVMSVFPSQYWWIIALAAIALSIKLLLQLGSTIPVLSDLAFGFRPIVIGYLHLVLLGVITLFIIGYAVISEYLFINKVMRNGLYIFVAGIIINEVLLMIQGVAAIDYLPVAYINESLLVTAFILLTGTVLMFLGQRIKGGPQNLHSEYS